MNSSAPAESTTLAGGAPIRFDLAPENCRQTLKDYIEHRIPTGSFLEAFLSNDLMGAMGKADDTNRYQFFELCCWLYNYAPSSCFGSPARVRDWLAGRKT